MSAKRPADAPKETPAPLKQSKADDAYLTAVQAETDRIKAEKKRLADRERIPIAPFSEEELAECMKNLDTLIVHERAEEEEYDYLTIPFLDYQDDKNSYFLKLFRGSPRVFLWHAEMESKKPSPAARAWVRKQCIALLKPVVERWNQEHERFKLMFTNMRHILLVDLVKNPNALIENQDDDDDDDE